MSDDTKLTDKQALFVKAYVVCLNATESARLAGYKGSDNALAVMGHTLLRNPKIRSAIDDLLRLQTLSQDEILGRLSAQARADMGDFIDPDTLTVNLKRAKELGITHLIKKIKQTIITNDDVQTEIFEFELHDPQKALVHLGRAYTLFSDKVTHDGSVGLRWEDVMKRDDDDSDTDA